MAIGYKVVLLVDKNLLSIRIPTNSGTILYKRNQWAEPEKDCGPLSVFKRLKYALKFSKSLSSHYALYEIWKCEYVKSDFKKFWNKFDSVETVPEGTDFADKVKIIIPCVQVVTVNENNVKVNKLPYKIRGV